MTQHHTLNPFDAADPELRLFDDDPAKLAGILRDLKRAQAAGQVQFTPTGLMVLGPTAMNFSGIYDTRIRKHEDVLKAIQANDPEREAWARAQALVNGDDRTGRGYVEVDASLDHNLVPTVGRNFILDLIFRSGTSKINAWYFGAFKSAWTPAATAVATWAGSTNNLATEIVGTTDFTGTARPLATFGTGAATSVIATSTASAITIAAGVTNLTLHGATLNEISTIAYDADATKILLSAAAYSAAKAGLAASDVVNLTFQLTASST